MTPLTRDEAATVIARWWSQWLREPATHDNGDPNPFGAVLAGMLSAAKIKDLSPDAADRFETALRRRVFNARAFGGDEMVPSVDYHPNSVLRESAISAGIADVEWVFPVKTRTRIEIVEGGFVVEISNGYGAPWQIIGKETP